MKRLDGMLVLPHLNLRVGERFWIGDTVYEYRGIVKQNGKEYDKIMRVK